MHPNQPATQRQRVLAHIADTDVGGFFDLLTAPQLLELVEALQPPFRERVYSPTETLAMFMAQALYSDGTCRAVVNAAAVRHGLNGEEPLATNTGAYCEARARLPLPMIATLAREATGLVTKAAPGWWIRCAWRPAPYSMPRSAPALEKAATSSCDA